MNNLGIDVGKRKCRAALKDDKGMMLDEYSSLVMMEMVYTICFPGYSRMENALQF